MPINSGQVELASVVLRHVEAGGAHYDWMIQKPGTDAAAGEDDRVLATWRVAEPPDRWRALGRFAAERIGDHRRAYLSYEGELSGGRGTVERIDAGLARAAVWAADHVRLHVAMGLFRGEIALRRGPGGRWEASVLDRASADGMMPQSK